MNNFLDVRDFNVRFGLPHGVLPVQPMNDEAFAFRLAFLKEEFEEAKEAYIEQNLVGMADALIDLVYAFFGTILFLGNRRANWPTFQAVDYQITDMSMYKKENAGFLTPLVNKQYMIILKARIDGFALSHNAAVAGEPNALELCYQNLNAGILTCYIMAALMSIPWEACWNAVHSANMQKTRAAHDGSNSKRGSHWDVVKPEGWIAPDLTIMHLLSINGWVLPSDLFLIDEKTGKVERR